MAPPRFQGTVTLLGVFDMRRSRDFYENLLGFSLVQRSAEPEGEPNWAWLRKDDVEIMLNTLHESARRPATEDPARSAFHADTTLFIGCRDLDDAYRYYLERGLAVEPPITRDYGMKQLHLRDPDGYGLCLQWTAEDAR